jgi:hypothetical protein
MAVTPVVACQVEYNIPVVGKSQVMFGWDMRWLRIDRYYKGGLEDLDFNFQLLLSMQCENVPRQVIYSVG